MEKTWVLMEDRWHKRDVIIPGMEAAFGQGNVEFVENASDFPWDTLDQDVELFISQKGGTLQTSTGEFIEMWVTEDRQNKLAQWVKNGGAALFIHCGITTYPTDGAYYDLIKGVFLHHPAQQEITYKPVNEHPITQGVQTFTQMDEQYHCQVELKDVTVLMAAAAQGQAALVAGWCHEYGKGRVAVLTPGHNLPVATDPNMVRLVQNAAKWVLKK